MNSWIKLLCHKALTTLRDRSIKSISTTLSHGFSTLVALVFCALAVMFVGIACVILLWEVVGSLVWALIIMAVANLVLMAILVPITRRLGVKMLSNYFNKRIKDF